MRRAVSRSKPAFVVVPNSQLDEATEVEDVGDSEDVRPAGLKRVSVRLRLFEVDFTGVAVLAEQYDEHVGVCAGTAHVARFHRYFIRCRFTNNTDTNVQWHRHNNNNNNNNK